jgi:hypothetical protein
LDPAYGAAAASELASSRRADLPLGDLSMARALRLSFPSQFKSRVIECLKEDEAVGQLYIFEGQMIDVTMPEEPVVDICRIELTVEGRRVSRSMKMLREIGLGEDWGDIDVTTISCSTQKVPRRSGTGLCRSFAERQPTLEIHAAIVGGSHLTSEHILLVLLASGLAAVGLLMDNIVLVLASFFISPLMSMVSWSRTCAQS